MLAAVTGCEEKPAPSKKTPAPIAKPAKTTAAETPAKDPPKVPDAVATTETKPTEEAKAEPVKKEVTEPATETASAPPSPPPPPERLAILTPGGPLLVDVTMTLDGRPYNEAFDKRIDELLAAADTDGDGGATWKELLDNAKYLNDAYAGRPEMSAREKRDAIEEYDLNEDGHVDRREAAKWLGRDDRAPAAAFKVRSSRAYIPNARTYSRIWQFLDRDANGELSADELARAGQALLDLDADDDQSLTMDELATLREQLIQPNNAATIDESTRDAAFHLQPGYTIERLDYLLPDLYSSHQALGPESFASLPKLFAQLDQSGEEWLDRDELDRLLTVEPHLRINVDFAEPKEGKASATVTMAGHQEELRVLGTPAEGRLNLDLGGTRLAFSATDLVVPRGLGMNRNSMGGDQIQLFVHDREDALFEQIDADGDGRLGAREMASCGDQLAQRDANGDGALSADELPYALIVAFVRGAAGGDDQFFLPERIAAARSESIPAWFRAADFNGDGDIGRREFLGSAEKFKELDADGNGFIDAAEGEAATPKKELPEDESKSEPSTPEPSAPEPATPEPPAAQP